MTKKTNLKIGFVLDSTLDIEDGVQQYILVLGDWLKSKGHEIHYMVGETKRTDIENLHSLTKNITVAYNGNRVSASLPAGNKKIKKLLSDENFDIIHIQVPYSPFYGAKFIKYAGSQAVVVGTFHILPYGALAFIGTWLLGIFTQKSLNMINQLISVSTANQKFSTATFKKKSIVVPNMVNIQKYLPPKNFVRSNDVTKILFLGRLTQRKGCMYLVNALGLLSKKYPDVEFILQVAGRGEQHDKLKKKAKALGISNKIRFLGYVSNQEKAKLMQNADISVFPSYSGESFGIVLIEAMAAKSGVVICGDNPGYRTVLGQVPECLINVKNTDEFSNKLHKLIIDSELRNKIYIKQQEIIKKYDHNEVARKILNIYEDCKKQQDK
jgi:phosphatidyl-myo-inositol alpha-mannosyltransferase